MIYGKVGEGIMVNDVNYIIGSSVCCNEKTDYYGLVGTIREIRTGTDKDTDNVTNDIYVYFQDSEGNKNEVILAADMITPLDQLF